ncbi:hypothetical protein ACFQ5H_16170 [Robinsoniella peoriensis]
MKITNCHGFCRDNYSYYINYTGSERRWDA